MVQGQLVINYVTEGYLTTVLDDLKASRTTEASKTQESAKRISDLLQAKQQIMTSSNIDARKLLASVNSRLNTELQGASKEVLQKAKLQRQSAKQPEIYTNAVDRRTLFDLRIEIGAGSAQTTRWIEKCKLISNEQIIDQNGQPLFDAYGFVARRLR